MRFSMMCSHPLIMHAQLSSGARDLSCWHIMHFAKKAEMIKFDKKNIISVKSTLM